MLEPSEETRSNNTSRTSVVKAFTLHEDPVVKVKQLPLLPDTIVYAADSDEEDIDGATYAARQLAFEYRATIKAQAISRGDRLTIVSATLKGPFGCESALAKVASSQQSSEARVNVARVACCPRTPWRGHDHNGGLRARGFSRHGTPDRGPDHEPLTPEQKVDSWLEKCMSTPTPNAKDTMDTLQPLSPIPPQRSSPRAATPIDQLIVVGTQDVQAPPRDIVPLTQDSINTIVAEHNEPGMENAHERLQNVLADCITRKRPRSEAGDDDRAESAIKRIRTKVSPTKPAFELNQPGASSPELSSAPDSVDHDAERRSDCSITTPVAALADEKIAAAVRNHKRLSSNAGKQSSRNPKSMQKPRSPILRSSRGTIKGVLKVGKRSHAAAVKSTPVFEEPDLAMTTSFEDTTSFDSASLALPERMSPTRPDKEEAHRSQILQAVSRKRALPLYMSSSQDPRVADVEDDFDLDGAVDDIGSFLGSWDEEKKAKHVLNL